MPQVVIGNYKSTINTDDILKEIRERKDAIAKSLEDMLAKFPTVVVSQCLFGDEYVIANFTVADARVAYRLMHVFFYGSNPWNVTLCNWPASKENENRVLLCNNLAIKDFRTDDDIIGLDNLKREIDYKICILKTELAEFV